MNYGILSYPKCGRTWLRFLVGTVYKLKYDLPFEDPMDLTRMHLANPKQVPPLVVSHVVEKILRAFEPKKINAYKIVFLIRHPMDAAISKYYHDKYRKKRRVGGLDAYVAKEARAIVDYIASIYAIADRFGDFHMIRYEDMQSDCLSELDNVMDFLDEKNVDKSILDTAVRAGSFNNMRKIEVSDKSNSPRLRTKNKKDPRTYKTREGRVGGYKTALSADLIEELGRYIHKKCGNLGY